MLMYLLYERLEVVQEEDSPQVMCLQRELVVRY